MIVFVHIPKTAGTTFSKVAERNLGKGNILEVYGDNIPIASQYIFNEVRRKDWKMVRGHFCYGVHKVIPEEVEYVTVLRHPLDRVISLYNYIRRDGLHPIHEEVLGMSLAEFVGSGINCEVRNGQVRQLCGILPELPQTAYPTVPTVTSALYKRAKENLKGFGLVGVQDKFGKFLESAAERYGWKEVENRRHNVSKHTQEPDDGTIALIMELNKFDYMLYEEVRGLWQ